MAKLKLSLTQMREFELDLMNGVAHKVLSEKFGMCLVSVTNYRKRLKIDERIKELKANTATIYYYGPEIKRSEAKNAGLKRFFTGVACVKGHICERFTSNSGCVQFF